MSTHNFAEACATYRLLREKGYPEKATLNLVGNRHGLSRIQRNCLFRGVVPAAIAASRKEKIVSPDAAYGHALALDWYNVLITVESYLQGHVLYSADDGVVRDASETHGSYRTGPFTPRAIDEIIAVIARLQPARVDAFLDEPIAFSGLMAEDARSRLAALSCPVDVALARSADSPLKAAAGIVATSDSALLDTCPRVLDLAAAVLAARFSFHPAAVHELFEESPGEPPQ
jgi:hypothetical protein